VVFQLVVFQLLVGQLVVGRRCVGSHRDVLFQLRRRAAVAVPSRYAERSVIDNAARLPCVKASSML
jgi:hypothetical protein